MIDSSAVESAFTAVYGDSSLTSADFSALCEAVCSEISPCVRENADPDDARLISLAAACVLRALAVRRGQGEAGLSEFKAGDVSVKRDFQKALSFAEEEHRLKLVAALPLLKDTSFYFGQVKI
ncbi:MAG: hypothetical protein J5562_00990 [Clostridia bacterium]|nr:hypothetical protein [Clostridia bacterium]